MVGKVGRFRTYHSMGDYTSVYECHVVGKSLAGRDRYGSAGAHIQYGTYQRHTYTGITVLPKNPGFHEV